MQLTKVTFYEFPDLTRSMDILIGVFLSIGFTYCWKHRYQIKEIFSKNFTYIFVGTIQIMTLWLYFAGSELHNTLLLMGVGSIILLFQDDKILTRIFQKLMN